MDPLGKTKQATEATKNAILSKVFKRGDPNSEMLWGVLHIKIIKCNGLRNLDRLGVTSLLLKRKRDKSDPYVTAFINDYRLLKTKHIDDDLDPVFNEEFYCPVAHLAEGVTFKVKDKDLVKDESLGKYTLPVGELIKTVDDADIEADPELSPGDLKRVGVHKVVLLDGKKSHGTFEFFIEFIPTRLLSKTMEVPGVYFKETKGNDVKLYMNADDDGSAPVVKYGGDGDDEKVWTPPRLWRDIYDAICDAKHFVYVAGWSVDTDQYLLRGEELKEAQANGKYSPRIGELLNSKAEEGLVVNLMQWDDYSSNFAFPGMMGTYDEKTREFFKKSKVIARFMNMTGGECNTMLEGQNKKMAFTHHQKYIIVDAPRADGEGRELFAFVGGIDLTEGRWDNRKHPLFRSLQGDHKGDTYTKCFKTSNECGPRQPWHDIHSAVRGPEAIHLALAFEERWTKQGNAGELVSRSRLGLDDESELEHAGNWCAQLSRSIDSRVNSFDPSVKKTTFNHSEEKADWRSMSEKNAKSSKRFETAAASNISPNQCLDRKKGRLVDNSIHMTNIHHIRRAKHFIYIESQYFMGSSFMWDQGTGVKCGNMIAAEIALKICEKIAAKEPFAVYILLPMWMEGIPQANATQGLLYFQRVTIEAMYKQVEDALEARMANSSDYGLKVSDYLNIYCLGTRETAAGNQATGTPATDDEALLAKTRRHQIYIHSKFMIVDDDVALIGTANINQRSMDGCRDSEIMMTSWQPDHLATKESIPKGDIHAFRLHTWASITGQMDEVFRNPSSPECVNAMNKIADENWQKYIGAETVDMESHLLPFPLEFENGKIKPRTGLRDGNFTDTKASVLGKKSMIMPEIFLT
ncbi:hypothetical protein ACHAXR_008689 [Thalassiosira sp. AJA248-18]